ERPRGGEPEDPALLQPCHATPPVAAGPIAGETGTRRAPRRIRARKKSPRGRILHPCAGVLETKPRGGEAMKRTVIRYRAKPEAAEENARLIAAVFAALKAEAPAGLRYMALRLPDDTFVHVVESEGASPLLQLAAFQAFTARIAERCSEKPLALE